jgi:hypothetical protein
VAAHFLLTASNVCALAADALFENSEICCDAGLDIEAEGEAEGAVVVVLTEGQL